MKFIAAIILAAAIAGVSANVHSTCKCVSNGDINKRVTAKACRRYPRAKFYNKDESVVVDATSVLISVNPSTGECQTKDAATREVTAHIGGDEFAAACTNAAPVGVNVVSVC